MFLILVGFTGLYLLRDAAPIFRLAAASIGMIWVIKLAALLWQLADGVKPKSLLCFLAFLLVWPGVLLAGFIERKKDPPAQTGSRFLEAWLCFVLGAIFLITVSLIGKGESTALNYAALFSLLLMLHLGLVEVVADGLRLLGFSPISLFDRPFLASSLRDFWSLRWNRAFVDMNKIFLLNPLRGKIPASVLIFSIFLVSGLLHELGISYADEKSWGFPLLYFALQGCGMEIEKFWKFPRPLVWLWIVAPAPLLFTPTFTNLFLGGLAQYLSAEFQSYSFEALIRMALIVGGVSHFLVLVASLQVPGKLGWHAEFQKLQPLNRKVFWTYGGYILSTIIFMGIMSIVLSRNISALSSVSGKCWLIFISLFWWARVLTDFFYFSHNDWPKGPLFEIGHVCLTTLFLFLVCLYTALTIFAFR
ncbi:MAG: wax synthase family protein [Bdellovibrionota bacterium]